MAVCALVCGSVAHVLQLVLEDVAHEHTGLVTHALQEAHGPLVAAFVATNKRTTPRGDAEHLEWKQTEEHWEEPCAAILRRSRKIVEETHRAWEAGGESTWMSPQLGRNGNLNRRVRSFSQDSISASKMSSMSRPLPH